MIKQPGMQCLGEDIICLMLSRNWKDMCETRLKLVPDCVVVRFNVSGSLVENEIGGNVTNVDS